MTRLEDEDTATAWLTSLTDEEFDALAKRWFALTGEEREDMTVPTVPSVPNAGSQVSPPQGRRVKKGEPKWLRAILI